MATPKRTRRADGSIPCNCLVCNKRFVNRKALVDHIEKIHAPQIPEGWSASRYENYLRTGKTEGKCVICGKPTPWNPVTEKYGRMCGSDTCRKTARDRAKNNYIDKHGKEYTLKDPEQQRKMVYARKQAGKYIFEDETTGKKYEALYDSGYGREFFEMIDTLLFWPGSDIMAPSPHTYYYEYEGEQHFYIPDAYIYTLNLEVELKDGGKNPNTHPKILAVDKVKERLKDEVMESLKGQVNYIKICDKNYAEFFAMLAKLRGENTSLPKWESKLSHVTEGYLPSDSNYGEMFNSYYLDDRKYDNPGGWDEEHFSKTLDSEINNVLSNCKEAIDNKRGDKIFYVYTRGANFFKTYRAVLLGAIHVYWRDKWRAGDHTYYDYEWDYQEEVRVEDCYDLEQEHSVQENSDPVTPKLNLIKRNDLLINPVLNYDALLENYRRRLFHKRLNKKEWDALYNELLRVRDNLKVVINGNSENDKRLNYEAKKALVEVERFITYMEDQSVVKESVITETKQYAKKMSKKDIIHELDAFAKKYPTTEWMVGFKAALVLYGLCDECNDIDVFATDDVCNKLIDSGCHTEPAPYGGVRITVTKRLEVFPVTANHQTIGNTVIDGFRVDEIENIKAFYKRMNRPKDRETIARIEAYQANGGVLEGTDIFTSGDFAEYAKYADLDGAREDVSSYKKGIKSLTDFQRIELTDDIRKQYLDKCPDLFYGKFDSSGSIWMNQWDDSVVGYVRVKQHEWMTWLDGIKVEEPYRGYGLGDQMMNVAQNDFKVHYLTVNNKNKAAMRLFRKHGFGVYDGEEWCSHMTDLQKPSMEEPTLESSGIVEPNYTGSGTSTVYFTNEITPESLVRMYHVLGVEFTGKTAVKISTGEPGGHNFLQPSLIGKLVQEVDGTIVECNTAYPGKRNTNEVHLQTFKDHGFTDIAECMIMDKDGEFAIEVNDGYHLKENFVGEGLKQFNSMIVLSHFKGHQMAGYGGALKNMSIGVASAHGKANIHTAGRGKTFDEIMSADRSEFQESMADADKAVMEYMGKENIIYINVANRLSVDCDCDAHPHEPEMADIGIFASLDPVAVDQACIDAVYNSEDEGKRALIDRIKSRNGIHTIEAACNLGLGNRVFKKINIDSGEYMMEGVVSRIDPNYVGKDIYNLSDYRRVPIGKDILQKYKGRYPFLKHIREDDGGMIWFDGDKVVAVVGAAPHRDTTDPSEIWVHSFEISKEYQKHGLARQILNVAIGELNAQYLSVAKRNEVALELYKKMGFVTYGENKDTWFMKLRGAKTPKFADRPVTEACKDVATARKFVSEVGRIAKKYDANYFLVTDGASGTSNNGNPAVSHARQMHEEWEKQHGFDPDEDWSKMWRVTYDGIGIYEAYRIHVDDVEWRKFKNSPAAKWLPVPPKYGDSHRSYFTYEGLQKFNKLTLPVIVKTLDPKRILIEEIPIQKTIKTVYKDDYQLVTIVENAMLARDTELSDIIAFNKMTNNMEYIVPNNGNIITEISEEDYYKYYRLLSPEEFERYNGGVCWDYVLYEAKYFDKYFPDVKYKTFYFASEKGNSHTFLIFELEGVHYWYESSWKRQVGLYGFRSERDAVDYVTNLLLDDLITRENNGVPMRGYVFAYDVDEIAVGTRCWPFMRHMIRKLNSIGDRKCLVKKRIVRPIRVMKGKIVYENTLLPAFHQEPLMETFRSNADISFGQSKTDVLDIIKTMTPTEQLYLGTPGGRQYNWSRSEFYQEVLYAGKTPVAFLVVSEIPANRGVGHMIIGVRSGNQYRHKGYASMLINRFINSDRIPPHIISLEWGFDDGNVKSEKLAAKFGFNNPTVSEDQVHHRGYIMTQSVDAIRSIVHEGTVPVHESLIEATRNDQPYFPVFIFLSYTGTRMAQLIKSFTHDPYAHSSISFDTTLENMISFNRDGMVTENIANGLWKKKAKTIKYSLYMYMATAQEYDAMKQFVDELLAKKSKLKYNMLGLTNFIFGRGSEREDKFFCSEFVASIISAGNNTLLKKSPHMTTPYNLAKNKNFIFVKKGILSHYDWTVVDKIIAEKLEEGGFENVIIK